MKFRPAWMMVIVVALALSALWAIRYIDRLPPQRLASLLGLTLTVSDLNGTATPAPSQRLATARDDGASSTGIVTVQTFSGPRLLRTGTGTAVSADGLILTTISTAPYGARAYLYQVTTLRGDVVRASWVASDVKSGLTLLKADAANLDAILFDASAPLIAGSQLQAVSSRIQVSKFVLQRLPVWIGWSSSATDTTISMDRVFGTAFNGARLIDDVGHSVGLLRWSGSPLFVPAVTINTFLDAYLAKPVNRRN